MRAEILACLALAMLTLSLASVIPPSLATTTYQPGVHMGDWWKYGSVNIQCSVYYCPPEVRAFQEIRWINSTVTNVTGNNVTIQDGVTFANGTLRTSILFGNVETGQGNLTYQMLSYLIAGGLVQRNTIYNSQAAPTINTTLTEDIFGFKRPVNFLEVSNSLYTLEEGWDQASGILVSVRLFSNVGITASIYLNDAIWIHTPDFTLSVVGYHDRLTLELGETLNATVRVQSVNGFKGPVNLTATIQPGGPILRLDPTTVEVPDYLWFGCDGSICYGSGWANSTLSISVFPHKTMLGTYTATITAENQTVSRSVQLAIIVTGPDFKLTANPSMVDFPQSWGNIAVWIGIQSLEGFIGQVYLSAVANDTGLTASLANDSLTLLPNGYNGTLLTLRSTTLGSYEVRIDAISGSRDHTFTVRANVVPSTVGDFTLTASPDNLITMPRMNATSTITVTSVDNFSGDVSLDALVITMSHPTPIFADPFGPRALLDPTTLTLTENSSSTVTLTVQPGLPVKGDYFIEIRASGRFLDHSLNVTYTISTAVSTTPPAGPPTQSNPPGQQSPLMLGLSPMLFYGITGGALATVAGVGLVFAFWRKRRIVV